MKESGGIKPDQFATDGLTPEEDKQLAHLLFKWQGGNISSRVFTELARMIPQPIVEVVFLRVHEGVLETLLIPRPDNDIVWPGMFHTPGTALRAADYKRADHNPLQGAFERVQREVESEFSYPVFAGRLHRLVERGPEAVEVYTSQLSENAPLQQSHIWYPVAHLPANPQFIQHQLEHVILAAQQYVALLQNSDTIKVCPRIHQT